MIGRIPDEVFGSIPKEISKSRFQNNSFEWLNDRGILGEKHGGILEVISGGNPKIVNIKVFGIIPAGILVKVYKEIQKVM